MDNFIQVSLANISGGAAGELFDRALGDVIANILDINTDAKKEREITVKVKIKPKNDERRAVNYKIDVTKKLVPARGVESVMYVGQKEGELIALESNVEQGNLPFETGDVVEIKFREGQE